MVRLLSVLLLLLPRAAHAADGGVVALDSRDETVVIGAETAPQHLSKRGEWHVLPHVVELEKSTGDPNWWLAKTAITQDGFVRARIDLESGANASVMLRANSGSNEALPTLSGYAVSFGKGRVELWRIDGNFHHAIAPGAALKGAAHEFEVVAWMIGPHLSVKIHDGKTLQEIASLTATDATYPSGLVGIRVGGKIAAKLTFLSLRPAGAALQPRSGPAGAHRYLRVPIEAEKAARSLPNVRIVERETNSVLLKTTPTSAEAMLRGGFHAVELALDEPGKEGNRAYQEAKVQPPVPTATGFRLDLSYKDAAMVEALLRGYAQKYPKLAQLVELGRTAQNRPIWALKIHGGSRPADDVPSILLNGAHHALELAATEFALDATTQLLETYATDPAMRRRVDGLTFWCVPLVNPDGNMQYWDVTRHSGRKNGRDTDENGRIDASDGVDLNRNYPFRWHTLGERGSQSNPRGWYYRGAFPASEREVQAMMRLADSEVFAAAISFHTNANAILVPYTIDDAKDPEPNEAWAIAELMAEAAGLQANGKPLKVKRKLYSVDGVDQDWHRAAHGTLAYLVEGTFTNPGPVKLHKMLLATRPTWQTLVDHILDGPHLRGQILDAAGLPVATEVRLREVQLRDGEIWTTRCRDGRFHRTLGKPSRYQVSVVVAGAAPFIQDVDIEKGPKDQVIRLPFARPTAQGSCAARALCSIDARCAQEHGECAQVGLGRYCEIDGKCRTAGEKTAAGICDPARNPWSWSEG